MQMKRFILLMCAVAGSGSGFAADFIDTARVVSSVPVHERISEPRQECWIETVSSTGTVTQSVSQDRSIGGALLGGVVGGVVGNQIGQGNGNAVATAAGAIAGALIGDRVANQDQNAQQVTQAPQVRQEQHCRTIENYKDVIRGYDVTYRYSGKDVTVRLPYQPGDTVRVGVSVVRDR
jgi:uncharacterized protein YcfJ